MQQGLQKLNIKTLDDLGDLATDELLELLPSKTLSHQKAEELIMQARAHWFQDDATSTQ